MGRCWVNAVGDIYSEGEVRFSFRLLSSRLPFFLEQVEGKSLSSTLTEGLLHFIRQKNDRRAPEHSLDGPGVMSVLTGRPAANRHTHVYMSVGAN